MSPKTLVWKVAPNSASAQNHRDLSSAGTRSPKLANKAASRWRRSTGRTFALWRVLAAVSEYVDLIDRSVGLKQLLQLLLRPGARDLAHEHLDGVRVRLVGMLQRPVHLPGRAVAVEGRKREGTSDQPSRRHELAIAKRWLKSSVIEGYARVFCQSRCRFSWRCH